MRTGKSENKRLQVDSSNVEQRTKFDYFFHSSDYFLDHSFLTEHPFMANDFLGPMFVDKVFNFGSRGENPIYDASMLAIKLIDQYVYFVNNFFANR